MSDRKIDLLSAPKVQRREGPAYVEIASALKVQTKSYPGWPLTIPSQPMDPDRPTTSTRADARAPPLSPLSNKRSANPNHQQWPALPPMRHPRWAQRSISTVLVLPTPLSCLCWEPRPKHAEPERNPAVGYLSTLVP